MQDAYLAQQGDDDFATSQFHHFHTNLTPRSQIPHCTFDELALVLIPGVVQPQSLDHMCRTRRIDHAAISLAVPHPENRQKNEQARGTGAESKREQICEKGKDIP